MLIEGLKCLKIFFLCEHFRSKRKNPNQSQNKNSKRENFCLHSRTITSVNNIVIPIRSVRSS